MTPGGTGDAQQDPWDGRQNMGGLRGLDGSVHRLMTVLRSPGEHLCLQQIHSAVFGGDQIPGGQLTLS